MEQKGELSLVTLPFPGRSALTHSLTHSEAAAQLCIALPFSANQLWGSETTWVLLSLVIISVALLRAAVRVDPKVFGWAAQRFYSVL